MLSGLDFASSSLVQSKALVESMISQKDHLNSLAKWVADLVVRQHSTVLICGNGGLAAEASHFAGELVGRYKYNRPAFPAIALHDPSVTTCAGNDYGFDRTFSRQVEAFGKPNDLLIGMSTSGLSQNVCVAIKAAKEKGLHTLALTGQNGGGLLGLAEREWLVQSWITARIQEAHLFLLHLICEYVDELSMAIVPVCD